MHICYVLGIFPKISETFVSDEISHLLKSKHNATLIILKRNNEEVVHENINFIFNNAHVHWFEFAAKNRIIKEAILLFIKSPASFIKSIYKLKINNHPVWRISQCIPYVRQLKKNKVQHIHVHFADYQLDYAATLAVLLDIPLTFTMHGYDIRDLPIGKENLINHAKFAKKIVSASCASKKNMVDIGIPSAKISVIPCGVDINEFTSFNKPHSSVIRLLTVARLHPIKSHQTTLRALSILKKNGHSFFMTFVGDGEMLDELIKLTSELVLTDRVKFVGVCDRKAVLNHFKNADIHILASLDEGLGVSNLEAMASGLAVIATEVGGLREVIQSGYNGLLVPVSDPVALANAIEMLKDDRNYRDKLSKNARETIVKKYSRTSQLRSFIDLIS